jgi:Spy/CpxP family protein refolding chaperone
MAMCKCGKCADCKKRAAAKKTPSYEKGKYTESKDKTKDAAMTKNLTPEQKKRFEKADKAHGEKSKPKTMQQDKKIDAKIIKKIVKGKK